MYYLCSQDISERTGPSTTQHRRHQSTPAPPFEEKVAEVGAVAQVAVAAATAAAFSQLQPPP
nr:unnamed protein product [Callosobruchus chinensis]